MSTMTAQHGADATTFPASTTVSLAEAARRTGLADSAATMKRVCARRDVATGSSARSGQVSAYVDLCSFDGGPAALELGDVIVVSSGRLA